jgi:hypothetical protein
MNRAIGAAGSAPTKRHWPKRLVYSWILLVDVEKLCIQLALWSDAIGWLLVRNQISVVRLHISEKSSFSELSFEFYGHLDLRSRRNSNAVFPTPRSSQSNKSNFTIAHDTFSVPDTLA